MDSYKLNLVIPFTAESDRAANAALVDLFEEVRKVLARGIVADGYNVQPLNEQPAEHVRLEGPNF